MIRRGIEREREKETKGIYKRRRAGRERKRREEGSRDGQG
jgi:hypothetical protein